MGVVRSPSLHKNDLSHDLTETYFRRIDRMLASRYAEELLHKRQRWQEIVAHSAAIAAGLESAGADDDLSPPKHNSRGQMLLKPRMDVCNDPRNPRVFAAIELPGLRREEVALQLHSPGRVVVSGERRRLLPLTPPPAPAPAPQRVESETRTHADMDQEDDPPRARAEKPTHAQEHARLASDPPLRTSTQPKDVKINSPSSPAGEKNVHVTYPVQEVRYGRFQRTIAVPATTQASDISASLVDGMLVISWPRGPAPRPKADAQTIDVD